MDDWKSVCGRVCSSLEPLGFDVSGLRLAIQADDQDLVISILSVFAVQLEGAGIVLNARCSKDYPITVAEVDESKRLVLEAFRSACGPASEACCCEVEAVAPTLRNV